MNLYRESVLFVISSYSLKSRHIAERCPDCAAKERLSVREVAACWGVQDPPDQHNPSSWIANFT